MKEKILLIIFGVSLGLLVSEILARVYFYSLYEFGTNRNVKFQSEERAQGVYRVGILGGSTSNGFPYEIVGVKPKNEDKFSLPSFTKIILEKYCNYKDIIIDRYCDDGWTIQKTVETYFKKVKYKPDLLIILSGFNEVPAYYSINMKSPPEFLLAFANLKVVELFLRTLFLRSPKDVNMTEVYKGDFFSEPVFSQHEKRWIKERYVRYLKMLIKHCKKEKIPLIIVIPDGNYTFPPTRSIYKGPQSKKEKVLKLFKSAFYEKYFLKNLEPAKEYFLQIKKNAEFADLYYELGDIYYKFHEFDKAKDFFRRSIDIDGFSFSPSSDLREVCRLFCVKYRIPFIDMHSVVTRIIKAPVPDFSSYIDNAHLKLEVYYELNKVIVETIKKYDFLDFSKICNLNEINEDYSFDEVCKELEIPDDFEERLAHNTIGWLFAQSNYYFLKYRLFLIIEELLNKIKNKDKYDDLKDVIKRIDIEKKRVLNWLKN